MPLVAEDSRERFEAGNAVTPKSPVRALAAEVLAQMMLAFVMFHECAHVYRGHVGYAQSQGTARISERDFGFGGVTSERNEIRIAQEYDANVSAMVQMFPLMTATLTRDPSLSQFNTESIMTKLIALGGYCVLALFESADMTKNI